MTSASTSTIGDLNRNSPIQKYSHKQFQSTKVQGLSDQVSSQNESSPSSNEDQYRFELYSPKRKISQSSLRTSTNMMRSRVQANESNVMPSIRLIHTTQKDKLYQANECNYALMKKSKNVLTQRSRRRLNMTNENPRLFQNETDSRVASSTSIISQLQINNTFTTNDSSGANSYEGKSNVELQDIVVPSKTNKKNVYSHHSKKKKKRIQCASMVRAAAALASQNNIAASDDINILNKQFVFDNTKPYISAQTWAIIDATNGNLLFGRREAERRQIASLTKIMTLHVVLDMMIRLKINEHSTLIRVLPSTCMLTGTTACLLSNDTLSVWELLFGMMLPSGNDAAQTLAIYFGLLSLLQQYNNPQLSASPIVQAIRYHLSIQKDDNEVDFKDDDMDIINQGLNEFYKMMNREAMIMGLKNTNFYSAHGMHHDSNYSSSQDVAILSYQCMKQAKFRQVVKTLKYTCESRTHLGHLYQWQNTNKLLEQGYSGLKTGITPTAGPCLAATISKQEYKLIIVILGSKSMEQRWIEVPKLFQWATNKISKIKESDLKPSLKKKLLKKLIHL